jgi:hypothetical protein
MEYNKIIAVTGLPGLYELLSSKTDGAIVRSLDDKSTKFVSSRIHNFSHLESIEIYTVRDNVNLVDILKAMEDSKEKLPDEKDGSGLKNYFTKVYPDLDFERVYSSDLKKMVKWYVVLKNNDVEIKLSEPAQEDEATDEQPEKKTAAVAEKPAKKAAAEKKAEAPAVEKPKKAEPKKAAPAEKPKAKAKADADEDAAGSKAKKPAKKATAEKKAAPAAEKPKKAAKKK